MSDTTTAQLFDVTPEEADPGRPISELARIHRAGVPLLNSVLAAHKRDPEKAIRRVRDSSALVGHPDRGHQVTIRYTTPGRRKSAEWEAITCGEATTLAVGWLMTGPRPGTMATLARWVLLDAEYLAEDTLDRPGCLVAASRHSVLHHAPGGAEFLVVDVRRVSERTLIAASHAVKVHTADLAYQEGLF